MDNSKTKYIPKNEPVCNCFSGGLLTKSNIVSFIGLAVTTYAVYLVLEDFKKMLIVIGIIIALFALLNYIVSRRS